MNSSRIGQGVRRPWKQICAADPNGSTQVGTQQKERSQQQKAAWSPSPAAEKLHHSTGGLDVVGIAHDNASSSHRARATGKSVANQRFHPGTALSYQSHSLYGEFGESAGPRNPSRADHHPIAQTASSGWMMEDTNRHCSSGAAMITKSLPYTATCRTALMPQATKYFESDIMARYVASASRLAGTSPGCAGPHRDSLMLKSESQWELQRAHGQRRPVNRSDFSTGDFPAQMLPRDFQTHHEEVEADVTERCQQQVTSGTSCCDDEQQKLQNSIIPIGLFLQASYQNRYCDGKAGPLARRSTQSELTSSNTKQYDVHGETVPGTPAQLVSSRMDAITSPDPHGHGIFPLCVNDQARNITTVGMSLPHRRGSGDPTIIMTGQQKFGKGKSMDVQCITLGTSNMAPSQNTITSFQKTRS